MPTYIKLIFSVMLLLSINSFANDDFFQTSASSDFLPIEEAYLVDTELNAEAGSLSVFLQPAPEYYLYGHAFKARWLADGKPQGIELDLPQGIEKQDEYFGLVSIYYDVVELVVALPENSGAVLELTYQGCADAGLCYPPTKVFVNTQGKIVDEPPVTAVKPTIIQPSVEQGEQPLLLVVLFGAFIGGLILNLMPCVLPVLSIKLLHLLQQDRAQTKRQATAYFAGVVISFLAVATILIALKQAGHVIGWGFQLQQPWFVANLAYLFIVLALGMAGLLQLGQGMMNMGSKLTEGNNTRSAFFTGMLAVVVASPCSAPFMGSALGFALTQNTAVALLVFASLGVGMALPLSAVAFIPALHRFIPKPGAWMEGLKEFFVLPLLLTAVWLLWVFGRQTSVTALVVVLVGVLLIGFALWCFASGLKWLKVIGVLSLVVALMIPWRNDWLSASAHGEFEAYSAQALEQLREQEQLVFVNLTADWCITCLANERVLASDDVKQVFAEHEVHYLVGDWTNYDAKITHLLESYGRSGVPLYLLFPKDASKPAIILPQILSKGGVIKAIKNQGM